MDEDERDRLLEKARDMIAALAAALEDKPQGPWTYATSIETRGIPGSTPGREPAGMADVQWHVSSSRFAHVDYCAEAAAASLKVAAEAGQLIAVRLVKLAPEEQKPAWPGSYPDIAVTVR